jgi:GNAT superfamily N-acetyltransferase
VVGRIVASVDHALNDSSVGHFGYFEVQNNSEAAKHLLQAAETWVRERGKTQLHGPVNLSIYHNYRVMTRGFEHAAHFGEPRSPEYYLELLASSGYEPHARWYSWDVPSAHFAPFAQALGVRVGEIEKALPGFKNVPFDLEHFEQECEGLHPIVRETFKENYGGTDIELDEFMQRFMDARHFMHPSASSKVVDPDGRVVGYSYTYADPSPDFVAADGDYEKMTFSAPSRDRLFIAHTFGILKEHRKSGIAEWLFKEGLGAMTADFDNAIGALAKEGPAIYRFFGEPSREYAVYARSLV